MRWEKLELKRCESGIARLELRDEVGTETAFLDMVSVVTG